MPSAERIVATGSSRSGARALDFVMLVVACAVLVAFRLHAFELPLETDECNYAYIARRLLAGDRLYMDVWDHQPFGVFAMLAGVIAIFGDAPNVFRWTACAFSLVSLLLIYDLARRIAGQRVTGIGARLTGLFAAMLFAVVSSDPGTAGEGCQREIYMNTLILAAWWLALRWFRSLGVESACGAGAEPSTAAPTVAVSNEPVSNEAMSTVAQTSPPLTKGGLGGVFFAGAALGFASTLKTVVAVHWVVLAGWIAWVAVRHRGCDQGEEVSKSVLGRVLMSLAYFAAGPVLVWGSAFAYFAVTGRWHEFVDAVFYFNVGYSEGGGVLSRFGEFFAPLWHRFIEPMNPPPRFPFVFDSALPLWIFGGASAMLIAILTVSLARVRVEGGLVLAFVVAGFVATCLPGRFWPHYYGLMIPAMVIATAVAVGMSGEWWAVPNINPISTFSVARASSPCMHRQDAGATRFQDKHSLKPEWWAVPTLRGISVFVMVIALSWTSFSQYRHYLSQPPFGLTVNRFNSRDFWGRGQGENVASVTDPDDKVFVYGNDAEIYYYSGRRCASRYTMITGLSGTLPGAERRREILMSELRLDPPRLILVLFDEPPFDEWRAFLREFYGEPVGWDYHDRTGKPILFVLARKDRPIREINWNWDRASVGGWAIGER